MAKDFESLKQQALVIKNEVEDGANSSERIGGILEDIVESMKLGTCEFNVSSFYPTSGISGGNKYTLETAIAQVPAELRTAGLKVSFLNSAGKPESWKYQGGSWAVANFIKEADGGNKILEWAGDVATTRKQVSTNERKAGMQISYKHPDEGWVNEQFIGTTTDDTSWSDDNNWELIPNDTYIKDLYGGYVDTSEFLMCYTDSEGRFLFGIKYDGSFEWSKGIPTPIAKAIKELDGLAYPYSSPDGYMEITTDSEGRILSYRDKKGVKHENSLAVEKFYKNGKEIKDIAEKSDIISETDIKLEKLDGVQDHSLPNLFDKNNIRAYNSDFADKVYAAIGNKTGETGCYSNNIECKEGDWFTRSDFGTGIIVVMDEKENILGNVADAAYSPTIQIKPAKPEYDFSRAKYASFVVMIENLDSERIVKAKYMPTINGDFLTIPKLKIQSDNIDKDTQVYFKSNSGRYYQLQIDDSGESPNFLPVLMEGIPPSELPSDFPSYSLTGKFSQYYNGLVFSPVEGGVANYLYELSDNGLVKRYFKQKVNCPRIIKEGDTWYYYGVSGSLNSSSGKLNIYKAKGESFELVKGNLGDSKGGNIEPHDCLVLSVNPLHYVCQKYVSNQNTVVNGETKVVTALHVEEIYEGNLVWEWHSEDYPELWVDSHMQGNNADYLHNNSISVGADGNLYLNNKHANQIIVLNRTWDNEKHTGTIGQILWKIGGDRTSPGWNVPTRIMATDEQQWFESHDAVMNNSGLITMYDNKASNPSRILEFNIDTSNKILTNFKAYTWEQYRGRYMGSVDKLGNGIYLVSWGSQRNGNAANAGIYDFINKKVICEIRFDNTGSSAYRVYGIPKNV